MKTSQLLELITKAGWTLEITQDTVKVYDVINGAFYSREVEYRYERSLLKRALELCWDYINQERYL